MKEDIRNRVESCGVKLYDCREALVDAADDVVLLQKELLFL